MQYISNNIKQYFKRRIFKVTDTEKLNALIEYIKDAERFYLERASKGIINSGIKSMAIQDILLFAEHELGIEYVQ